MIEMFESAEQTNATLQKWQTLFGLDDYVITLTFVPFEDLNAPGMNHGLFTSTVKGGWKTPLVICLANDHKNYKNKSCDKRNDELILVSELLQIKKRILNYPYHYQGARKELWSPQPPKEGVP